MSVEKELKVEWSEKIYVSKITQNSIKMDGSLENIECISEKSYFGWRLNVCLKKSNNCRE